MSGVPVPTPDDGDMEVVGDRRLPSKGERQRRALLDGLTRLLATRPIGELTVGEIAADAGVRRSGYYFYFESKYTALAVVTAEIWSELMDRAGTFTRFDQETPAEYLDRTSGITSDVWREHEAVLVASIQAIPLDEQLARMWKTWNERLAGVLTEQVLKDRGVGLAQPASADVPLLVSTLLEMSMHMFYLDRLEHRDHTETRRVLDTNRAIWLASVWGITGLPTPKENMR